MVDWWQQPALAKGGEAAGPLRVCIVGAGFSGIGMAVKLREMMRQAGEREERGYAFLLLEKGGEVGGTWAWNKYPGCACDVVSPLYSFSWAPNAEWTTTYPSQPEILAYLKGIVAERGLERDMLLNTEMEGARFDTPSRMWEVRVAGRPGPLYCHALVSGMGGLHTPAYADIPGRERFQGPQMHTTRWDTSFDPADRIIAVIGSGASAVQVVPELRKTARKVVVVQRTPNWMVPRGDTPYSKLTLWLFAAMPLLLVLVRWFYYFYAELLYYLVWDNPDRWAARMVRRVLSWHITREVHDQDLAAKLTPTYAPGCKRVLITDAFYRAVNQDNVAVDTRRISAIVPQGLQMDDGSVNEVDTLVWATGFQVMGGFPPLYGQNGVELNQRWQMGDNVVTKLGIVAPEFPNFFILLGPNTGLLLNLGIFYDFLFISDFLFFIL
ncbi:MAG: NAD(P)/FAD-dependent oxidoreductase [archaeon]|nr:NAD(P)/FAD-dependent oxidoreductase [archaeon]